jgi:hypothetical protein
MNTINSNAAKQNIQQTAYQRAIQPMTRSIKTGPEQFDISDTDENTQQQIDDAADDLDEGRRVRAKREDHLKGILENELADPTQIDDIMDLSSARGQSRNLRGTSSSSAASGSIAALHSTGTSTASGSYLSASSGSSGATSDIPFEEVEPIKLNVKMDDLHVLTEQHMLKLHEKGEYTEVKRLEKILNAIAKIRTKMRKKEQTDDMVKEYSRLKGVLIATLNEAQ